MSRAREIIPQVIKVDGGLNISDEPTAIEDNELQICQNVNMINKRLEKRYSFMGLNRPAASAAKRIKFVGHLQTDTISQLLVAVEDGVPNPDKMYFSNDGGTTWTECFDPGPAAVSAFFYKGIQYGSSINFVTTAGQIKAWDGVNFALTFACPANCLPGDEVLDRYFIWAYALSSQTIRFSDPGNFSSWPAANSIQITNRGANDVITALVGYKDRLVIFRKDSIYILHLAGTPVNWQLKEFVRGIGNSGLYSVCKTEDWIYFIGRNSVYRTNLSTIEDIGGPIKQAMVNRRSLRNNVPVGSSNIAFGNFDSIVAHRNMVICSINVGSTSLLPVRNHRIFVYHLDSGTWTEWIPNIDSVDSNVFCPPLNMISIEETSKSPTIYSPYTEGVYVGGLELSGELHRYSRFNSVPYVDSDGQYDVAIRTKEFTFEAGMELKKIPYKTLYHRVDPNISAIVTDIVDGVQTNISVIAAGSLDGSIKLPGPGYARRVAVNAVYSVPGSNDTTGMEIKEINVGVRIPRPIQVKAQNG